MPGAALPHTSNLDGSCSHNGERISDWQGGHSASSFPCFLVNFFSLSITSNANSPTIVESSDVSGLFHCCLVASTLPCPYTSHELPELPPGLGIREPTVDGVSTVGRLFSALSRSQEPPSLVRSHVLTVDDEQFQHPWSR